MVVGRRCPARRHLLRQRGCATLARLVNQRFQTADISGQLVILGSGTSVGVPAIGCPCGVCRGGHPRNQRTRCAVVAGLPGGNLLIDTPPDLRSQLLREDIGIVHSVLFTHEHADHIFGLDDLRLFQFYLGRAVPVYCEDHVAERIRRTFDYAFSDLEPTHSGAAPQLAINPIQADDSFQALGRKIIPIRLRHGPRFDVLGFRIGNVAYCTDTNEIPLDSWHHLEGLDVLILDALRRRPHVSHFSLDEAVDVASKLKPRRTVFTHMSHDLDYESVNRELLPHMELGYDGMRIELT